MPKIGIGHRNEHKLDYKIEYFGLGVKKTKMTFSHFKSFEYQGGKPNPGFNLNYTFSIFWNRLFFKNSLNFLAFPDNKAFHFNEINSANEKTFREPNFPERISLFLTMGFFWGNSLSNRGLLDRPCIVESSALQTLKFINNSQGFRKRQSLENCKK